MATTEKSFTLCGQIHAAPMHICGFFDSEDKRYDVILPFLKEGLEKNDEVLNILESTSFENHCNRLAQVGIPVEEKLRNKQLKILSADETYLKGGSFAADKMYDLVEQALNQSKKDGYDSIRACGDMTWALRSVPGTDQLIQYEARLNELTPKHSCSLVCMYDLNRFSATVLADILATHPYVILNGHLYKNPNFVEPFKFLQTLIKRPRRPLQEEGIA